MNGSDPIDIAGAPGPAEKLVYSGDPELEATLRQALQPFDPPAGFADRVMAAAQGGTAVSQTSAQPVRPRASVLQWPHSRLWITGAVAAALVAGVLEGGEAYRRVQQERQRVVQATEQFQTTERITVRALAQAREQLQRAGVPLSLD